MGSSILLCLGLAWLATIGLLDGAVLVFSWAPPIGVAWCWLSPLLNGLRELMAEGEGGCGALIYSSVAYPKKLAKSAGNGIVSPRSWVRSNWTCFHAGPWGKHSVADLGGEWGHPAACVGVKSGHILLTSLLLDSCCWGWRWSILKKQCSCSSAWCEHSGLGDGEVCLWGLLMEAHGGASLGCCYPSDWLWCHHALLLLWGHVLLIRESPLSCLATSFLLSTKSDLAQDDKQAQEHLLPLDMDWALPITPCRPALTKCWPSSLCSLAMNLLCCMWGRMLGTNLFCPWYICSTTSRISWSVDPRRVPTNGLSGTISFVVAVWCELGVPWHVLLSLPPPHSSGIVKQML